MWSVAHSIEFLRKCRPRLFSCGEGAGRACMDDLVVAHWPSEVESTAPLDFLLRHGLWTPFRCPMSCKIRSIISATCDFTTKSDGIWPFWFSRLASSLEDQGSTHPIAP